MSQEHDLQTLGVAEAKRRFGELIERVRKGERFLVTRRGQPAVGLVPPGAELRRGPLRPPQGLAAGAGALADWEDLTEIVQEIYRRRRTTKDRAAPELD